MTRTTLAGRIADRRGELGISQTDLAHAAGVTLAAVMQWESGQIKSLKGSNLMALADALNVLPRWLESGDGEKVAIPDRKAFRAAIEKRDKAGSERAKLAWERIAASFAKAALASAVIAALCIPPLLAPRDAYGSTLHNAKLHAFVRQVFDNNTHCRQLLARALAWLFGMLYTHSLSRSFRQKLWADVIVRLPLNCRTTA